MRSALKHL